MDIETDNFARGLFWGVVFGSLAWAVIFAAIVHRADLWRVLG
jgi:hypothetical protein